MQSKTRQHALRIREALLALPDHILLAKVLEWGEILGIEDSDGDATDEYAILLGYQVQSAATGMCYEHLDALFEAEEDTEAWTVLPPTVAAIRQAVSTLPSDDVYHALVGALGEVLRGRPLTHTWGEPPGWAERGGGYTFMKYCAIYLRALASHAHPCKPREGTLLSQQDFDALQDFLASDDAWDILLPDDTAMELDEDRVDLWPYGLDDERVPWSYDAIQYQRDLPLRPPAPAAPEGCICDGTFGLTQRWLVAAGGDVTVNVAALQALGATCDCTVVTAISDSWLGPELRPAEREWTPWDQQRKKKKKKGQKSKQKIKH